MIIFLLFFRDFRKEKISNFLSFFLLCLILFEVQSKTSVLYRIYFFDIRFLEQSRTKDALRYVSIYISQYSMRLMIFSARLKRRMLTDQELEAIRNSTSSLRHGSTHMFRNLRDKGN